MFFSKSALIIFAINCAATALAAYTGSEIRSKTEYFEEGECLEVTWQAKPAQGNCVISLFSIYNGDRVFNNNAVWSEIGFETFGGSVGDDGLKQYQTQYISATSGGSGSSRKGHEQNHYDDEIFNRQYHNFSIKFCPADNGSGAEAWWKLDGKEVRYEQGGDLNNLKPPLDIYASTWISRSSSGWACTTNDARPDDAQTSVQYIRVSNGDGWEFNSNNDLNDWDKSNWGFGHFDGVYSPGNIYITNGQLRLDLEEN